MRIGLTYDLKQEYLDQGYTPEETAEFDREETICGIEQALQDEGFETERIGSAQALARSLALGRRWDMVFNIAEGLHGMGRESLVPALLDAWQIPYVFSDPAILGLCLHKGMTKHVVRDLGLPTPDFALVQDLRDLRKIDTARMGYPLFVKPVAEGTGKGVTAASRCNDFKSLRDACRQLLDRFRQPVLVESYLPGREFTVGIVGTGRSARVLGVIEIVLLHDIEQGAYGYGTKDQYESLVEYHLVDDALARRAATVALAAYRGLGIRDGGRLDLRADARGEVHFIEANPLAGLNPVHSDLPIICRLRGIPYRELISMILHAALEREGLLQTTHIPAAPMAAERAEAVAC